MTDAPPPVRTDSSELNTKFDSPSLTQLPLPTRNFLQLLTLAPVISAPLTNNNAIGRNSPSVSVNGSRVTQNNYQINGIYANDISLHVLADVGIPAPESISEVNVQTSMYDASVAGAGGSVQVATKSGSNQVHSSAYEYFRNEALNANDANLKAVNEQRPVMRRNVYGVTVGGPIRRNRAFFFSSYQGTREANGAHGPKPLYECSDCAWPHGRPLGCHPHEHLQSRVCRFDLLADAQPEASQWQVSNSDSSNKQRPGDGFGPFHLSRRAIQCES